MTRRNYTDEQRAWIAEHCADACADDVVAAFNEAYPERQITHNALRKYMTRNGLKGIRNTRDRRWKDDELEWCRERVRSFDNLDSCVSDFKRAFPGSECTDGMARCWFRNHKPKTCRDTRFKSGGIPHNTHPIGTEKVFDGIVFVKVRNPLPTDTNSHQGWVQKARLVWERENGMPVPEGHVVRYADGDRTNFDPGNLVAISRRVSAAMNSMGLPYHDRESLLLAASIAEMTMERRRICKEAGLSRRWIERGN